MSATYEGLLALYSIIPDPGGEGGPGWIARKDKGFPCITTRAETLESSPTLDKLIRAFIDKTS